MDLPIYRDTDITSSIMVWRRRLCLWTTACFMLMSSCAQTSPPHFPQVNMCGTSTLSQSQSARPWEPAATAVDQLEAKDTKFVRFHFTTDQRCYPCQIGCRTSLTWDQQCAHTANSVIHFFWYYNHCSTARLAFFYLIFTTLSDCFAFRQWVYPVKIRADVNSQTSEKMDPPARMIRKPLLG